MRQEGKRQARKLASTMRQQIMFSAVKEEIVWKIKFSGCSNFNNLTMTGLRAGSSNSITKPPLSALDFKKTILSWLSFNCSEPPAQSDHYRGHPLSPHLVASTGPSDFTSDTSFLGEMSLCSQTNLLHVLWFISVFPSYCKFYKSDNLLLTIVLVTGTKMILNKKLLNE